MTTFGPEEVGRIARHAGLAGIDGENVLRSAGAACVPADEVADAWNCDEAAQIDLLANARERIGDEIEMLLHASRNGMRNLGVDAKRFSFSMREDGGYYT